MLVNRLTTISAVLACAAFSSAQGLLGSDWVSTKFDPVARAMQTEAMYKTFKSVACGIRIYHKRYPVPADAKGYGSGQSFLNEYFWQPGKFRIEYVTFTDHPVLEYLASDKGKMMRLGPAVGDRNTIYRPSQPFFNVSSDAQLVEAWPKRFSQYLFTPFAGGNATLSRYVTALKKGTGGYSVSTWERTVAYQGKLLKQYRIVAERNAKGKLPASRVEMVFDARLYLPLTVLATYGKNYDVEWRTDQWSNHANLKVAGKTPFDINQ